MCSANELCGWYAQIFYVIGKRKVCAENLLNVIACNKLETIVQKCNKCLLASWLMVLFKIFCVHIHVNRMLEISDISNIRI